MVKVTRENMRELSADISQLPNRPDTHDPIPRAHVIRLVSSVGLVALQLLTSMRASEAGDPAKAKEQLSAAYDSAQNMQLLLLQMSYGDPEDDNG